MIQYLCRKHQDIGGIKAFSVLRYSDLRLLPQAAITHRATVRVQEASGSNPDTPTISSVHNGFELWTLDFFVISSFFVMYRAGF